MAKEFSIWCNPFSHCLRTLFIFRFIFCVWKRVYFGVHLSSGDCTIKCLLLPPRALRRITMEGGFACEYQDVSRIPRMQLVAGCPGTLGKTTRQWAKVKLRVHPCKRLRNTHSLHVIVFIFHLFFASCLAESFDSPGTTR